MSATMKPFWRYYGGKWRAAPRYPAPQHDVIIEPFAGAAGYSLRHYERKICLVDLYPVVAGVWRYLIAAKASEIAAIPLVESTEDLPVWVPQEARWLVGFAMNSATTAPRVRMSAGRVKLRSLGRVFEGWSEQMRARVAAQVERIRHWTVREGAYDSEPNRRATWFVDPPYQGPKGSHYFGAKSLDYRALAAWCREREGQTIVCENEGAEWLPFRPFATLKAGVNGHGSREAIWTGGTGPTSRSEAP